MPISNLSFQLYTDSGLTAAFTGTKSYQHETDLSDNPQDVTLYLGSTETSRQLQAASNPGVDDIVITPANNLDEWEASTVYSLGQRLEPVTPNTYVYECTTAGTSDSSEPTWPTSGIGSTVVDGSCVWALMGKRHEITEIKLALSSGGLDTAIAGDPLSVATTIDSGAGNAVPIYMRITNAVTTVGNNTGYPAIKCTINSVIESDA